MTENSDRQCLAARHPAKPLPKRFYAAVSVAADGDPPLYLIRLDGRPARTPKKASLALPSAALAEAIAEEWVRQGEHIDPSSMPLTRLANTVIDGIAGREAEVAADIVRYAGNDLLCYVAEGPAELVARQQALWQPLRDWAANELGAPLEPAIGIMPVSQSPSVTGAISRAVEPLDAYSLAALHVVTTLTGSAVIALAVLRDRLSAEDAWAAAHVDEDWQISKWGSDAEASRRRAQRWEEMRAGVRLLQLIAKT